MKIRSFSSFNTNNAQQVIDLQEKWINSGLLPDNCNRLLEDQFTEENTIVIEMNDRVIGYLVFFEQNGYYEIDSVFVLRRPEYKGLGKYLIEFAEGKIKSLGGNKIKLCPMTTKDKEKLIEYYQNLGYVLQNGIMEKEI